MLQIVRLPYSLLITVLLQVILESSIYDQHI